MIIKKMALPRRTFLRGVGATLALPLLDAMVPAASALARTAATPPRRLGRPRALGVGDPQELLAHRSPRLDQAGLPAQDDGDGGAGEALGRGKMNGRVLGLLVWTLLI